MKIVIIFKLTSLAITTSAFALCLGGTAYALNTMGKFPTHKTKEKRGASQVRLRSAARVPITNESGIAGTGAMSQFLKILTGSPSKAE